MYRRQLQLHLQSFRTQKTGAGGLIRTSQARFRGVPFKNASLSLTTSSDNWETNAKLLLFAWSAGYAAFCLSRTDIGSVTNCEPDKNEESDEDEDPYTNLPEEDEETHCSMCKTFRKGPCRPFWRKLERCFKDHENEENGAVKCMKYFTPHQVCLMEYSNLYQLVTLDSKQEIVRDAELSVTKDERKAWTPYVDWGIWKQFVQEAGSSYRQSIEGLARDTPLWKRFPENTEPVLVNPTAKLPRERDGMILKIAYAIDQDGMVLGVSYNKQYRELLNAASPKHDEENQDAEDSPNPAEESKSSENGEMFALDFCVIPGETTHVTISAMYTENPVLSSSEKELLDALLFTSPKISLEKLAQS